MFKTFGRHGMSLFVRKHIEDMCSVEMRLGVQISPIIENHLDCSIVLDFQIVTFVYISSYSLILGACWVHFQTFFFCQKKLTQEGDQKSLYDPGTDKCSKKTTRDGVFDSSEEQFSS
jgi:hypothetical protein